MSMISLASAYPSTELSAVQLAMMIAVPVGLLFVWLGLIFLAARPARSAVRAANAPDAAPPGTPPASAPAPSPSSHDPRDRGASGAAGTGDEYGKVA